MHPSNGPAYHAAAFLPGQAAEPYKLLAVGHEVYETNGNGQTTEPYKLLALGHEVYETGEAVMGTELYAAGSKTNQT